MLFEVLPLRSLVLKPVMHAIPEITATKSQKQVCIINLTSHSIQEYKLLKSIHYNYHY